jgi:hypothetical protein
LTLLTTYIVELHKVSDIKSENWWHGLSEAEITYTLFSLWPKYSLLAVSWTGMVKEGVQNNKWSVYRILLRTW